MNMLVFFYFCCRYFNADKMAAKTSTEAGMLMNLGLVTLQESFGLVILRYFITILSPILKNQEMLISSSIRS